MNPTFKRAASKLGPVKSYVSAVKDFGDDWRISKHSPAVRELSEKYNTPDFTDYVLMNQMERGNMPRVLDRDLYGWA